MNLLKKIRLWFINDWKVIKVLQGQWHLDGADIPSYYTVYEIHYSSARNKYKLKGSGFRYKEHPMYTLAIKYLNEYESDTKVQ